MTALSRREYADARRLSPLSRPARRCQVCNHDEVRRIEALHTSGVSIDKLAEQFNVHRDAVWRHCKSHMTEATKTHGAWQDCRAGHTGRG